MKKRTKILSIILAGTLLLGGALSAYAMNDTQPPSANQERHQNGERPRKEHKFDFMAFFQELVDEDIISDEQKVLIEEKLTEKVDQGQNGAPADRLQEELAPLIETGTLSEETVEAMIQFLTGFNEERQAERELVKNMTEEEREAYFENREPVDPFEQMVEEGLLTEDENEAIMELLPKPNHDRGPRMHGPQGHRNGGEQRRPQGDMPQQDI